MRPVYAAPLVVHRHHGLGNFLTGLRRAVRRVIWSGAKVLGRASLHTGGNILTDIVRPSDENPRDIVWRREVELLNNLIAKLRGGATRCIRKRN